MAEVRQIELVAKGLTLGEGIEAVLKVREDRIHLNERTMVHLELSLEEGVEAPVLEVLRSSGVEIPDERFEGIEGQQGIDYEIPLSFTGKIGEGALRVLIKGDEYHATLAMVETSVIIRPPRIGISIEGQPLQWNGEDPLSVSLEMVSPGGRKSKGKLELRLLEPDGGEVPLNEKVQRKITVSGKERYEFKMVPASKTEFETLDLLAVLQIKGDRQKNHFRSAVLPEGTESPKVQVPGRASAGGKLRIMIPGSGIEGSSPDINVSIIGKDEGERIELKQSGFEDGSFLFDVPEGSEGVFPLIISLNGEEVHRSPLMIEETPPVEIRALNCRPNVVMPGSSISVSMDYLSKSGLGPLDLRMSMGGASGLQLRRDLDTSEERIEMEAKVPEGIDLGEHAGEVKVYQKNDLLVRELFPGTLTVRDEARLEFSLARRERGSGPDLLVPFLLPGERVVETSSTCGLKVHELSSGRRLLERDGSVVLGDDRDEGEKEALGIFLLHHMSYLFADRSVQKQVRTLTNTSGLLSLISLGVEETEMGSVKDPKEVWKVDPEPGKPPKDCTPIVRSYLEHLFSQEKDPAFSVKKVKGLGSDPIPQLSYRVRCLLDVTTSMDDCDVRNWCEDIMKSMKGSDKRLHRPSASGAVYHCCYGLKTANRDLVKALRKNDLDPRKLSRALRSQIFYLLLISLLRAEIVSHWADPALGEWDEVRVMRQRALKGEVSNLLDIASRLSDIKRRSEGRFSSYSSNMKLRRLMSGISRIDIKGAPVWPSGMGGETWSGSLSLDCDVDPSDLEFHVSLPGPSWQLLSPPSEREGKLLRMDPRGLGTDEGITLDIDISSPPNAKKVNRAVLFITPVHKGLEEEP